MSDPVREEFEKFWAEKIWANAPAEIEKSYLPDVVAWREFVKRACELSWQAAAALYREKWRERFDQLDSLLRVYRHTLHGTDCECADCRKMLRDLLVIEQEWDVVPDPPEAAK